MQHDYKQLLARAKERKDLSPHEKAQWQALRDYNAVKGKIVKVNHVLAYYKADKDGTDGRHDVKLKTPALVRIGDNADPESITRLVHDKTIDPEWPASLVEPHPDLDEDTWDLTALTVFGTAYRTETGDARRDETIYWEQLDPQPNSPGTLEVERAAIKAIKARRGQPQHGENVKHRKIARHVGMNPEGVKDYHKHADNVARIIAAGLASKASKGRIREAIGLYFDSADVQTVGKDEPQKPIIEVDRRG